MSTQHDWNAFSAGWIPSDDAINGRKNGLLQMDNVELDKNGSLSLNGGLTSVRTLASNPHTLFSRYLNNSRCDYASCVGGQVYRNGTSLSSGGDSSNAAFGTAFNYTLIASGNIRLKDVGSGTPANLGVGKATVKPTIAVPINNAPYQLVGNVRTDYVCPVGIAVPQSSPFNYMQVTADANGKAVIQTYNGGGPFDMTQLTGVGGDIGTSTDNDLIIFSGYVVFPYGCSLSLDVLLVNGDAGGDQVTDYFTYKVDDLSTTVFDAYTGVFTLQMKRSDFVRIGGGSQTWTTTYGIRLTFSGQPGQIINYLGSAVGQTQLYIIGGSHSQNGVYQFAQVNVNNTGSYIALSPLGPVTLAIPITDAQAQVTLQDPSGVDAQVNEVWLYARTTGGTNFLGISSALLGWTRVSRITSNFTTPFYVALSDIEAIATGIFFNTNLATIQNTSGGITDKIFDVIGPVNGRWYYFTTNFMYPSDINDPDLVNVAQAVRTCGSNSELFLWARLVAPGIVLVGTSCDIYILTGTFNTLADGSIDITYLSMGCKFPPVTYDATVHSGNVYYLSNDGWRSFSYLGVNPYNPSGSQTNPSGTNPLLVSPNTDRLYRGDTCYGYTGPNLTFSPGSARYPICIGKNKLWAFLPSLHRFEVYDFFRQYWRTNNNYSLGVDGVATCSTPDGNVLVAFSNTVYLIDSRSSFGSQAVNLLSPVFDNGQFLLRKDPESVKIKFNCNGGTFSLYLIDDLGTQHLVAGSQTSVGLDSEIDFSPGFATPIKTWQWKIVGTGMSSFTLYSLSFTYDPRPTPVNQVYYRNTNFGSGCLKRIRVLPVVIDTLGGSVLASVYVDNTFKFSTNFSTAEKLTKLIQVSTDLVGKDWGLRIATLTGNPFEPWEQMSPTVVQIFPIEKLFDQMGPFDPFKYAKIKEISFRLYNNGAAQAIPYTIYWNDATSPLLAGTLQALANAEATYNLGVPKGTSGSIFRVELGPTTIPFCRYYVRLKMEVSGRDTEQTWVTLPEPDNAG